MTQKLLSTAINEIETVPDTELTNADRAKHIELLHIAYTDHHDAQGILIDHDCFVAAVLADLRHYCDVHGLDFGNRDHLGHQLYIAELDEAEDAAKLQSCDDCKAQVPSIIGCPDGANICQACFDAGNH